VQPKKITPEEWTEGIPQVEEKLRSQTVVPSALLIPYALFVPEEPKNTIELKKAGSLCPAPIALVHRSAPLLVSEYKLTLCTVK
jgi:hypothetical protein